MNNILNLNGGNSRFFKTLILLFLVVGFGVNAKAQQTPAATKQVAPEVLPGKGPAEFDFFYAGEAKQRKMYIVRNGKITWSYIDTLGKGEISDAVLMKNGNVLFAHQFGVTLIDKNKNVLWNYDAPKNHETHTAQPIGNDHVVFIQNGDTAKLFVMNVKTNKIEKQFTLQTRGNGTHGQFRHARLTPEGNILVAHMDLGKIREYDVDGKQLLSFDMPGLWSVEPLKNGNILAAGHEGNRTSYVRELNRKGEVVWEYMMSDMPDYVFLSPQIATRLANGNTIVGNWFNQWDSKLDPKNLQVQAIEITPDKKVIWALRSWAEPMNLGPSTTIQLLNDANAITEKVHFGNIK
jgi:outer membrane protein assembly factor BamB